MSNWPILLFLSFSRLSFLSWPFVLSGGREWLSQSVEKDPFCHLHSSRPLDLQREMRSLIFVLLATGVIAGMYP